MEKLFAHTASRPDPECALPLHGGDLALAQARYGRPLNDWLDLSTGINPWPYPVEHLPAAIWHRLPDSGAEAALAQQAARYYGAAGPHCIVAGAGSQALIQVLPNLVENGSNVAVVGPTYGEHAKAWRAGGHNVAEHVSLCQAMSGDAAVVVVVNPNNPDGATRSPADLLECAAALAERGGLLVVDEAFGDVTPDLSLAGTLAPNVVVLRSFGKFFGLAGLRLGFGVAPPEMAERLRPMLGPWPASGPAIAVGIRAFADSAWIAETRQRLSEAAQALDAILTESGCDVVGGTDLFRFVGAENGFGLYDHLARNGILVRAFAHDAKSLRIGLPPNAESRDRLAKSLESFSG